MPIDAVEGCLQVLTRVKGLQHRLILLGLMSIIGLDFFRLHRWRAVLQGRESCGLHRLVIRMESVLGHIEIE